MIASGLEGDATNGTHIDYNGQYLEDCQIADAWTGRVKPWANNSIEAERLWKLSEQLVKQGFKYC